MRGHPQDCWPTRSERRLPEHQLVRLTVDLARPIPHAGFHVETEVVRSGRTVGTTSSTLIDGNGNTVATAHSMHIAAHRPIDMPTAPCDTPRLSDAEPGAFPLTEHAHDLAAFDSGVQVRYPAGNGPRPGPNRIWMRSLPLLDTEEPSPFQRICPLADCGNAVSRNADPDRITFMNTDLTIVLHRPPIGEWLGMDSVSRWESNGIGMSDSLLFDDVGPVGRALQSLILRPAASSIEES